MRGMTAGFALKPKLMSALDHTGHSAASAGRCDFGLPGGLLFPWYEWSSNCRAFSRAAIGGEFTPLSSLLSWGHYP
jgi:hypothetical protein